jgi:hypothetical protein
VKQPLIKKINNEWIKIVCIPMLKIKISNNDSYQRIHFLTNNSYFRAKSTQNCLDNLKAIQL